MEFLGYAFMFLTVAVLAATSVFKNLSRVNAVKKTKSWPSVEATVRSANLEVVRHLRFSDIQLPVFELSYVVGEKSYSERFALSMSREPLDSLMTKMVGRRLTVQYDPDHPSTCYIPGETLENCRIEQNIGSQVRFYPRS